MRTARLFLTLLAYGGSLAAPYSQSGDQGGFMGPEPARAKMRLVIDEAIRQADSELDKAAFRSGRVLANLFEKETALIGVAIPAGGNGKQIIVAFPADHFRDTSIITLAKEALADFARAASSRELQPASSQTPESPYRHTLAPPAAP